MTDSGACCNPLLRAFSPTSLALTAWLRMLATSGDQTSWSDVLGGAAAAANAARAPTAQADSSLLFNAATPDVFAWQSGAHNFNVNNLTYYWWAKPTAVASTQMLISLALGTGGFGIRCLEVAFLNANFRVDVYVSGPNGRRFTYNTQAAAGTPRLWGIEYDSSGTLETDKLIVTRSGAEISPSSVTSLGAGGTLGALVSGSGSILLGNFHNSATVSNPYGGSYARNFYARAGSKMAGATRGNLTQAARDALNAFEPLAA